MKSINQENSEHYKWGNDCDGWHLIKNDRLSIFKKEFHQKPLKFFIFKIMHNCSYAFVYFILALSKSF